jgi:ribosomal subunit interface protein
MYFERENVIMSKLQITVRSVSDTPVIQYHVNKYFEKLLRTTNKLISCKVVIDAEQRHRNRAKIFSVTIDVALPRKILVSRKMNLNLFVAVREAFIAIEKSLQKYNKRKIISIDRYRSTPKKQLHGYDPHLPQAG